MPWRLPEDLQHFKALTMGCPILMGRKTWQSLGRALPGRRNIVVSRDRGFAAAGAEVVASLDAAIAACVDADEAFVIGGADIYAQALPLAQCLQITEIDRDFVGDTLFPRIDRALWRETAREAHQSADGLPYAFVTYHHQQGDPHV